MTHHSPSLDLPSLAPDLPDPLRERLALVAELSEAARAISLPLYASGAAVTDKTDASTTAVDPVTEADIEGERAMRAMIAQAFPDDAVVGEELPDLPGSTDYTWTLDPIDGTRAFVAGVPVWSTLIAVSENGSPVLGLIDLPALGRRYWGVTHDAAKGAWREDDGEAPKPISTRSRAALSDCILGCTAPFGMFTPGELAAYRMIGSGVAFQRLGLDALGHALVAEGRMDVIVEAGMKPCDIAALVPVVEGAGGSVTGWHGEPAHAGRVLSVGDASLQTELLTYLGRAL